MTMTIEQLRDMHAAKPFRPFNIHFADGRRLTIRHPEFLARSPSGRTAIVYGKNDHFEVIDLLLVTSLETVNGIAGRRRR